MSKKSKIVKSAVPMVHMGPMSRLIIGMAVAAVVMRGLKSK